MRFCILETNEWDSLKLAFIARKISIFSQYYLLTYLYSSQKFHFIFQAHSRYYLHLLPCHNHCVLLPKVLNSVDKAFHLIWSSSSDNFHSFLPINYSLLNNLHSAIQIFSCLNILVFLLNSFKNFSHLLKLLFLHP